jgi:type VI secretion system FHA domain protein
MTLTLTIRNAATLENGAPTQFVLHRRGAIIGRADTCDWSLPDPQRHISSRHCEVSFRDDGYWLRDTSTNGTFVNGSPDPLQAEQQIAQGDLILIGDYEIEAELSGGSTTAAQAEPSAADADGGWQGWTDSAPAAPSGSSDDEWGEPQELPTAAQRWEPSLGGSAAPAPGGFEIAGPAARAPGRGFEWGQSRPVAEEVPSTDGWGPTHDASDMPDGASVWDAPQAAPDVASGWSSAASDRPPPKAPADIWGQIAENNVVDWARGGFGSPVEPVSDPLGLEEDNSINEMPLRPPPETADAATTPPAPARRRTRAPAQRARPAAAATAPEPVAVAADAERIVAQFLAAAGLSSEEVKGPPNEAVARAGGLLRRLVAGLVVLVEARARAKSQMGAEGTRLEFEGNNPIKFARSPEQALAQLLSPPERGFMKAERAIEDAFYDLQSHQVATLRAMQGALRATLDRFSPDSIRKRAETRGFLASILPAARDAALWRAYEREFSGVAQGSDEAFMDVFAKEFRKAYEEQSRNARQSPP